MKNIREIAIADPDLGLYSTPKNFSSIISPMRVFSFPPNIFDTINVLILGAKIIKILIFVHKRNILLFLCRAQ